MAIGMAGFVGAIARVLFGRLFDRINIRFPIGTLCINVIGCFLLGWFLTYADSRDLPGGLRLVVAAGFIGTFTTFSTFIYESNHLVDEHAALKAGLYLVGSLVLGLLAVRVGSILAE